MFILELTRVIKFAIQSLFRNFWLSIVTITIVILALFSISFLLIFNLMTDHVLSVVESNQSSYA